MTVDGGTLTFGSAGSIGGTGANVTVNTGAVAAFNYAINQASLNRVVTTSAGTVALGFASSNNLDLSAFSSLSLAASGTFTYSGTLTPNGTTYRFGGSTGNLTVSSALADNGGATSVVKTGADTLTLTGTNTFTGGVTVNGVGTATNTGSFRVTSGANLGTGAVTAGLNANYGTVYASAGNAFLFVNNTAAVSLTNDIVISTGDATTRYYTLMKDAGSSTTGTNLTLSGVISGGGANTILQLDSDTGSDNTTNFTLSGNNTIAGQVRLNRGYLNLANANALGTASLFLQTNANATAGNLNFSGFTTLANNVIIGTTTNQWINTGSADITLSGVVSSGTSGSGGFSKMGTGTLTLTGANTYNGSATTVANGTLSVSGTGRLNSTNYTGTLGLTATTSVLDYSSSTSQTLSGVISGSGRIVKSGTSELTLSGNNTFAGGVTVNGGRLVAGSNTALGTGSLTVGSGAAYGTSPLSGGTPFLRASATGDAILANNIVMSSTAGYYSIQKSTTGTNLTLSGVVSGGGTGVVLQLDSPTSGDSTTNFTLSGNNTFAGQVRLNRGYLTLGNANALGTASLFLQTNANATNGNLNFSGFTSLANNVIIGETANQWINTGAADITLSGVVSSSFNNLGGFSKMGAGTLTLTGDNTYSGSTVIAAGTLSVATISDGGLSSNLGASSSAAANLTLNGGTLRYTGADASSNRAFTLGTSGGTINASGSGALVLTSTTATALSGTDTARTLTLTGTNTGNNTYAGVLGNNGTGATSLAKSGAGTWVLTGANTYTGATTVSGGTLAIGSTGSINSTSTITVNSGATFDVSAVAGGYTVGSLSTDPQTLQGVGTVTGDVFIGASGTIRGDTGSGTGALVTRNVTINTGGQLDVEFGTGVTASRLDLSAAGGVLNLNNGAIIDPNGTLAGGSRIIANLGTGTNRLFVNGTAVNTDTEIAVYEYASGTGVQDFGTSGLKIDVTSLGLTAGDKFILNRSGNDLVLNFSPVPEPTTILGVAVGLVAVGGFIRKRLAKKAVVAA